MSGPDPELLAQYGTDEAYFSNLEKRASDTIFGPSTMAVNQGSFGRMMVGDPMHQMEVDRFRAEADAMNIKFRALESQIMGNTIENLGGPGTRRSAFTRAMMTQPYGVHPLLYAGGPNPVGGFVAPPAAIRPPPPAEDVPEGDMGELDAALDQEMEVQASVSTAMAARIGMKLAQMGMYPAPDAARYMAPPPMETTAPYVSGMRGRGTLTPMDDDTTITEDLKGAGQDLTTGTMRLGRGVTRAFGKAVDKGGQLFSRMGRGINNFMLAERQPTPRWGTGTAPARDVNQYGEPIY